jgi:3-phenylpropionate/cinnamic acid dioxygenase small subunit
MGDLARREQHGGSIGPLEPADTADEIEALKRLKARYCRLLDAKDWARWREMFTDDFVSDTSASGGKLIAGADAFVAFVRANLGALHKTTVHQIHAPELELTSATAARGIWALNDVVRLARGFTFHGYGHYHETYEKAGGQWRIKSSKLTRLREDIETPVIKLKIPHWLKNAMARALPRSAGGQGSRRT